MNERMNRRAAFTLLEVLLVLVIIGMLAALVAPRLFGVREKANEDAARAQIGNFYNASDYFRLHLNDYPAQLSQLGPEGAELGTKWRGPYLERIPKDPWGFDYIYEVQPGGAKPLIYSVGRDGQPGTADDIHAEEPQS
jgi:general secretion pathway protein G